MESRFSELLFLDVPETTTEQVQNYGLRINSSSSDKAPKMRDSVRLIFWDVSISSETLVMYSLAITKLSGFRDWFFLVFFGVSLETAANFLSFLNVAMIQRENLFSSCED